MKTVNRLCLAMACVTLTFGNETLKARPLATYSPRPARVVVRVDAQNKVFYQPIRLRLKHEDPPNAIGYCQKIFEMGMVYRLQDLSAPTGQWGPAPGSAIAGHYQLRKTVGPPDRGLCTFETDFDLPFPDALKDDQRYLKLCNEGGPVHAPAGYTPPNRRYKEQKILLFGLNQSGMQEALVGFSYNIVAQLWKRTGSRDYEYDNQIHVGAELQCAAIPCEKVTMFPRDVAYTSSESYSTENAVELPAAYLGRPYRARIFSGGKEPLQIRMDAAYGGDAADREALAQFSIKDGILTGTPAKSGSRDLIFSVRVQDSCPYNQDNQEKSGTVFKKQFYKIKIGPYQKPEKIDPKKNDSKNRPPKDRPDLIN